MYTLFALLALVTIANCQAPTASGYVNVIGDQFVGRGYDMATGTTRPYDTDDVATMWNKPKILSFTSDGVEVIPVPVSSFDLSVKESSSLSETRSQFSAGVSVGVGIGIFSAQASAGYTKTVGKIASSSNHVYLSETSATTNFVSVHTANLTSAFMADVAALPESLNAFNGSTQAYNTFIRKWGTHFIESATLGGRACFSAVISEQDMIAYARLDKNLNVGVGLSFGMGSFVGVGAGVGNGAAEWQTLSTRSVQIKVFGYGGNAGYLADTSPNYASWFASVASYPMPIYLKLSPYTSLIENGTRRDSLKEALRLYVMASLVDDNFLLAQNQGTYSAVTQFTASPPSAPAYTAYIRRPTGTSFDGFIAGVNSGYPISSSFANWGFDCNTNEAITSFTYGPPQTYVNYDSSFGIACSRPVTATLSSCTYQSTPSNVANGAITFVAPDNTVIAGVMATTSNQDRLLQFRTCAISGVIMSDCQSFPNLNAGGAGFTFGCPDKSALTSVNASAPLAGTYKSRTFSFTCCRLRTSAPASSTLSIGDVLITNSADAPVYYTLQEVGPAASVSKNVVRDFGGQAILSNPLGYSPIYSAAGLYIWGPQCAGGYVAVGLTTSTTATTPSTTSPPITCVHARCATACNEGNVVHQSGTFIVKTKLARNIGDIVGGTFIATNDAQGAFDPQYTYCIKASCLTQGLNYTAAASDIAGYWDGATLTCSGSSCSSIVAIASSDDNGLAIGLGVGLTFMFLICILIALVIVWFVYRRRQGKPFIPKRGSKFNSEPLSSSSTRKGTNPFGVESGVSTNGSDGKITAPAQVEIKTKAVQMSDGGFAVMKAPEVGLACSALYKDGHSYQGTIDVVEEDRCLIRWRDFPGQRDWVAKKHVLVNHIIVKK